MEREEQNQLARIEKLKKTMIAHPEGGYYQRNFEVLNFFLIITVELIKSAKRWHS